MYPQELEEFIDLVLADGEISDKERTVLRKKAIALGEDPDEIEIVVDGRLAKMKKAEMQKNMAPIPPQPQATQVSNSKYGDVIKCPQCGTVVDAGSGKCSECGYAFRNVGVVSSRMEFVEILRKVEAEDYSYKKKNFFSRLDEDEPKVKLDKARAKAIDLFPVPNAKEDLLEFLVFLKPLASRNAVVAGLGEEETIKAYKRKYKECVEKANLYFADDPQFAMILNPPKKKSVFGKIFGK